MSEQRQPTEHEWRLVAKVMEWTVVGTTNQAYQIPGKVCILPGGNIYVGQNGKTDFKPLHDHNDLARLVEAMQAAGYKIHRTQFPHGGCNAMCWLPGIDTAMGNKDARTDIQATFWAIVEALTAEEKRA